MLVLDDDNFEEYAVKNYRNPNCVSVLEFLDDLKKIKYIKRLINKYAEKGELREKLILNHIIFLSNVFGIDATVKMLKFRVEKEQHKILNSFFVFLKYVINEADYDQDLLDSIKKSIIWQT